MEKLPAWDWSICSGRNPDWPLRLTGPEADLDLGPTKTSSCFQVLPRRTEERKPLVKALDVLSTLNRLPDPEIGEAELLESLFSTRFYFFEVFSPDFFQTRFVLRMNAAD